MGSRNLDVVRGALRFDPGGAFDATAIVEYGVARNGSPPVVNGAVPGEALYVAPGTPGPQGGVMYQGRCPSLASRCFAPSRYLSANNSVTDRSDMDSFRATLTLNLFDTAIGNITSITGYGDFKLIENTDQNGTPLFLDDTQRRTEGWQFSQELRTAWDFTDNLRGILGGFYLKTHYDHIHDFRLRLLAGNAGPQPDQHPGSGQLLRLRLLEVLLRADRPADLAGRHPLHARADADAGDADQLPQSCQRHRCHAQRNAGIRLPMDVGTIAPEGRKSWDKVGWKLGADYKVTDDVLVYGYWARGSKSGGFTGQIGLVSDVGPYNPETVDTFEVGFKGDFADHRIRLNAAAFYTNYRRHPGRLDLLHRVQCQLRARPRVGGHAHQQRPVPVRRFQVPELDPGGAALACLGNQHRQSQHRVRAGGQLLVDHLWATNLFDKRYIQSVFDAPGVFGLVNYASLREYGVTAKVRF